MKTVGERLTYLIESQKISKAEFCKKNGLEYNSFAPVTTDKRTLGIHQLNKIAEVFPNLNINWLLYGKGNININDVDNTLMILEEPSENYGTDPMEIVFLEYLGKESVKNKLIQMLNNMKSEGNNEDGEITLRFNIGSENSELVCRIEQMIQNEIKKENTHKLPSKK